VSQISLVEALVGLNGLKKARRLLAKAAVEKNPKRRKAQAGRALRALMKESLRPGAMKGSQRRVIRSMATKAVTYMKGLRMYSECDGISGEPTVGTIVREAEWAIKFLITGKREFASHNWTEAIDLFFKSANIATNVISTAHMHEIDLPDQVVTDMENVISESTSGIKKVMKAMAAKVMIHHERDFHKGQPVLERGAAAYMRRLMEEKCCKG
jgi:hypothetical protein